MVFIGYMFLYYISYSYRIIKYSFTYVYNIQKLINTDSPALSKTYIQSRGNGEISVNQLWLTVPGIAGVMNTVVGRNLDARSENTGKHFLRCRPAVTPEQDRAGTTP